MKKALIAVIAVLAAVVVANNAQALVQIKDGQRVPIHPLGNVPKPIPLGPVKPDPGKVRIQPQPIPLGPVKPIGDVPKPIPLGPVKPIR